MIARLTAVAAALSITASIPAAMARPTQVVIDDPQGSTRQRAAVLESAEAGLVRSGWTVAPQTSVSGAMVLQVRIHASSGAHQLEFELRDAEGTIVAEANATCEICGLSELEELVADRSAGVVAQYEADLNAAPVLRIQAFPAHARVAIDGEAAGVAPVEQELDPGDHVVDVSARGYVEQRRTVRLERGTKRALTIRLSPASAPDPRPRRPGFVVGGAIAVAAGLAGVGAGAALVAIDNDPIQRNCNPDPNGNCARIHDTLTAGAVTLAVSAASIGTGVALLLLGRRPARTQRVSATGRGIGVRF